MRPRFALAATIVLGVALTAPAMAVTATDTTGTQYETARVVVPMTFPLAGGSTSFTDTYLTCRSSCARKHMGQDLMGAKMTPVVATFDGVITSMRRETAPGAGNYIAISADGRVPGSGVTPALDRDRVRVGPGR